MLTTSNAREGIGFSDHQMYGNTYYILLSGGFGDNLKLYCFRYAHPEYNIVYVNVPNTKEIAQYMFDKDNYLRMITKYNTMEVGQKNTNMSLFKFDNVISYIPHDQPIYTHGNKIDGNWLMVNNIKDYKDKLRPVLLKPVVPYSSLCKSIFKEVSKHKYGLIGIRWLFPYQGFDHKYFLAQSSKFIPQVANFIRKHKYILLMFDDWAYTPMFIQVFADLITDGKHKMITLKDISVNNIHELLKIASAINKRDFIHNYSGFYEIIDLVLK